MTNVNKSSSPYYDDYDKSKNFHEVLFRPRFAVQTRELNQIQTMFREQVRRFGDHVFEEGSMVIPGESSFDLELRYVTVNIPNFENVSNMLVPEFTKVSNQYGVTATVKLIRTPQESDPLTFYVQYEESDSDSEDVSVFNTDDILTITSSDGRDIAEGQAIGSGIASKFTINDGVYYLNGRFVLVPRETVILDKYSNKPSSIVTIEYAESVVTENDDNTLFDNAQGTPNFTAPGAHRLKVDTSLNVYDLDQLENLPENAVEIFRIEDGRLQKKADKPDYAVLSDAMAQRTYEESGDYTVDPFNIGFAEHTDPDKFIARMESGIAYVRGHRVETFDTENVVVDKGRETGTINNSSISAAVGNYIVVEDLNILPDVNTLQEIKFYADPVVTPGVAPSGSPLGSARVRFVRREGSTYRLYLFDILNANGKRSSGFVAGAASIHSSIGTPVSANIAEDTGLIDAASNSLVFPMNVEFVKSLNDENGISDTSYSSVKQYSSTTDTNGRVTVNAANNEVFVAQDTTYGFASFTDTGEFVDIDGTYTLGGNPNGSVITYDFGSANDGRPVRINIQTAKQQVQQKTKTVRTETVTGTLDASSRLWLDQADVFQIESIVDNDGNEVSISSTQLDKNITNSYYGISFLTTNKTGIANPVVVTFKYFQHSAGDYFGPDSYVDIDYKDIPTENSTRMSDALDFRPRMGAGQDFNSQGRLTGNIPTPYTVVRADVEHYLSRIDKVYVNSEGVFGVVKGVSSLAPEEPEDPSNAMVLYTLNVPAYTYRLEDVNAEKVKNRRYTMEDIGRLEKRLSNVEYYVSLNMLEQEAESKQVVDDFGMNRFKNGFFTDSFIDHSVGNYVWDGYHVSMDSENGEMRPEFSMNAIDLVMDQNQSSHVVENAGIVTLPFTHRSFISQVTRSETMNVNPYAVFRWTGDLELRPTTDSWIDTEYAAPDVTYRVFNNGRLTQSWKSWQLNWTGGVDRSSTSRTRTTAAHSELQPANSQEPGAWNRGRDLWRRSTRTFTTTTTTRTNIDVVNNRVIDTSVIPFMRSIEVDIDGVGHRPEAMMHFFFDRVNVDEYVRPVGGSYNDSVRTDVDGNFKAQFQIPNNDEDRFRTGEKTLTVTDASDGVRENSTSWADTSFTSTGIRKVRRRTIVATRSTTRNTRQTSVRWHDPLAQSFLVEREGGVFVTKINTFFARKDDRVPVTVELREMENGAPTQNLVPGAKKTLLPQDVKISDDGSEATTFEFPYPIYLNDGAEYCFVVWSNSNNYEAYIARMGQKDLGTGRYIVDQPYAGVLFKSQNNSTWTADQTADLQFEIFSAKFDINSVGTLVSVNDDLKPILLAINPIETQEGTGRLHITKKQHNYVVGGNVYITGSTGGNGISAELINGDHTVVELVDPNTIAIEVSGTATETGMIGGENVEISNTIQASVLNPNVPTNETSQTRLTYQAKGTTGQSFDGNESPYTPMAGFIELNNENVNDIDYPWLITNRNDESKNLEDSRSLTMKTYFESANDNLSPVVDMDGNSVITPFVMVTNPETEELDGSNNWANYVNKFVTLKTPANSLRVYLDTYKPQGSDIIISARFGNSQEEMMESEWMKVEPIVEQTSGEVDDFLENEYALDDVDDYTVYQVMIQLKSPSAVRYPICKRLRVLALGT